MAETYKKLAQGKLANSTGTFYTVPANTSALIGHIRLVNNTGANHTAKLYHDGTTDAQAILPTLTIEAGGWAEFSGGIVMEASDTMSGVADAATSITYTIYVMEIT